MEHEKAQNLLGEYLEGSLDETLAPALEAHLSQCEECKKDLDSLRKLMGLVKTIPPVQVPSDFTAKVRRRALRAGLFARGGMHSSQRMTAPFVGMWATWGIMLVLGLILVIVFIAQHQMNILTSQGQFVLTAQSDSRADNIEKLAQKLHLQVSSTKGPRKGFIILVPKERWPELHESLKSKGMGDLIPANSPAPDDKGIVHLLVLYSSDG